MRKIDFDWNNLIDVITNSTRIFSELEFSQPLKPYIRFPKYPNSRIIAMPAYVGGNLDIAGIKWISSFPDNHAMGVQRAHATTILNDASTGKPLAVISSAYLSRLRTAAVSGMIMNKYLANGRTNISVGIIGFGPIGQTHLSMIREIYGKKISEIMIFDTDYAKTSSLLSEDGFMAKQCSTWQDAYVDSDIVITCTTSSLGYIDMKPKLGSLHLNVSLRDYSEKAFIHMDKVIVDDWKEVSRENTDVFRMIELIGLKESDTIAFKELLNDSVINWNCSNSIIVNPMGLAIYDVSLSNHFYRLCLKEKIGVILDD